MKLKKRKIKYSAIFCLCWFAVLVFLVDGVLKFQTLVDFFGSYALVEIMLLLLVILPTLALLGDNDYPYAVLGECIWNLTYDEGEIPHDILKDCWKYSHIVQILRIIH